ncbi:uncharacterized protein [Antedon mediterranea]|uniref:uncharacterized protein n=1 Tax=Antedon mediterranea TaxID=105859 RepID=UPI003AF4C46C
MSNSREVIYSLPQDEWATGLKNISFDSLPCVRVLGRLWNIEQDKFQYDIQVAVKPMTRRGVLSILNSVYDPLGYAGPYVLRGKMIFQQLCRCKYDWDDPIPTESADQWNRWLIDLPTIMDLKVPRCFKPIGLRIKSSQLHHFVDASEAGYGVVTYLRMIDSYDKSHCSILMSKSRLAPLKTTTIPRLELTPAVEAIKLDKLLPRELEIPLLESTFWSDSMIVLWEHSFPHQWRYIDTKSNPGDDASRGLTASKLVNNRRWVSGPSYLWKNEERWPTQPPLICAELEARAEIKKSSKIYTVVTNNNATVDQLLKRYSFWYGLKRAVAWIMRFKAFMLKPACLITGKLTVNELKKAEESIIWYIQTNSLKPEQINSLKRLNPILIEDGLWRVGGRLEKANVSYQTKHQVLLPANHHVTKLIVEHHHLRTGHAGAERTLAETRLKYWIVRGRPTVKGILSKCITCRKLRARTETQMMGNLPEARVKSNETPFNRVGIDYFGPFIIKRARSELKRYGCIFTCLATRAIHLEVSHSLDTDSFINALQRFITRRGEPAEIRSDNGTNLVGAQLQLKQALKGWNQHKIGDFLQQKEIEWIFNTPTASYGWSLGEANSYGAFRTVRGVLGQQKLDDEGLSTLMCIVESTVNSRPITKLSSDPGDPDDPSPLTPNHLLLMRAGPSLPPGMFVNQDLYKRRWRQIQYMADIFWKRWLSEYLPDLQQRQKWLKPRRNLRQGDLVLMKAENTPRYQWPLGLITKIYPGTDGRVRSVEVKTQTGVYDRPIVKICLLEGCM